MAPPKPRHFETHASREALESWLQSQVGPAYDALKADPSRAITVDEIRAMLAIEHKLATANEKTQR
jgi:antitoxin ParD1/3/4